MRGRPGVVGSSERRSRIALGISVLLLLIGISPVLSHGLVNLSNSLEGQAVLPGTIAPGGFVSGQVTLANRGWLPISISLQPHTQESELPARVSVKIQDLDDASLLYVGPLRESMGPLLVLQPGEQVRILITLISDDPQGTAAVAMPLTYYWDALPALPWWWWIPVVLLIAGLLYYGFHRTRAGAA